jgi:hypothetical protein
VSQLRITDLDAEWATHRTAISALIERDVAAFNQAAQAAGVPAVVVPKSARPAVTM